MKARSNECKLHKFKLREVINKDGFQRVVAERIKLSRRVLEGNTNQKYKRKQGKFYDREGNLMNKSSSGAASSGPPGLL